MEDALDAAANEIGKLIRRTLHEERERLRTQRSHDSLHAAFLAALNAFLAHPTFTEVLLRYRRDDVTPVGRYARSLVDGMRQDMLEDLRSMGLDESRMPCLSLYVELLMGMILAAVEGLLDRRFTNVSDCAEALLRSSISLYTALGEKPFGEKPS
jgi:hypothetical protein